MTLPDTDPRDSTQPLLEVDELRVSIPLLTGTLEAVRGVGFTLNRGETLCLVGESGCGKSMTALALMGLLPQRAQRDANKLSFAGIDLLELRRRELEKLRGDRISMIFQEPMTSLNPAFTIGDQLIDVMRQHRRISVRAARERAVHLLERVGITAAGSRLQQYPHHLSGGLRQRILIAMALMCEPELILADEPTTALDVTIQAQLLGLLVELQRELGMAMVLITHDLGVVSRIADHVAVMYAGEVVEYGPRRRIFHDPLHPYTRGLMDCIPVPGRTPRGTRLVSIPGVVPSLVNGIDGCAFRDRCPVAEPACRGTIPSVALDHASGFRCLHSVERLRTTTYEGMNDG